MKERVHIIKSIEELLTYWKENPPGDAHDFAHAYETALYAVLRGKKQGYKKKDLLSLWYAGIWHDAYRLEILPDASDGEECAKHSAELLLKKKDLFDLPETIERAAELIAEPLTSPLGQCLYIADFFQLHIPSRVITYAGNIPLLMKNPETTRKIFYKKRTQKAKPLYKYREIIEISEHMLKPLEKALEIFEGKELSPEIRYEHRQRIVELYRKLRRERSKKYIKNILYFEDCQQALSEFFL